MLQTIIAQYQLWFDIFLSLILKVIDLMLCNELIDIVILSKK